MEIKIFSSSTSSYCLFVCVRLSEGESLVVVIKESMQPEKILPKFILADADCDGECYYLNFCVTMTISDNHNATVPYFYSIGRAL